MVNPYGAEGQSNIHQDHIIFSQCLTVVCSLFSHTTGCSLLLWVTLSELPVTRLDVLIAQMCAWSVFKPPCFLVLSDFLWQSVLGSAYSPCENGSSLSFELKAFHFHCFLFSRHKGWEKRDSQIYHTLDAHYFTTFYHIPFFVISPSPPDSLPFRYKSQILGLFL